MLSYVMTKSRCPLWHLAKSRHSNRPHATKHLNQYVVMPFSLYIHIILYSEYWLKMDNLFTFLPISGHNLPDLLIKSSAHFEKLPTLRSTPPTPNPLKNIKEYLILNFNIWYWLAYQTID